MKLFRFKKQSKKEEMAMCDCGSMCKVSDIEAKKQVKANCCDNTSNSSCCDIDGDAIEEGIKKNKIGSSIKILGSGCKKCNELEKNTITALTELGMHCDIDHVTDFGQIAAYGVMSTPALVIDSKVVSYGKVLNVEEVKKILTKIRSV